MNIINKILIILIKFYKFLISPFFQNSCRFEPSCSSYCIECLKKGDSLSLQLYNPILCSLSQESRYS